MSNEYKIIDFDKKYCSGIVKIFKDVFNNSINDNYYYWKNIDNPIGESYVKIAVTDEKVVGHACLCKYKFRFLNDDIDVLQSVDAMIDVDFRREGLYGKLIKEVLKMDIDKKSKFIFRFPNEAALNASIKNQKTAKICSIPQYLKILKTKEATKMFSSNPMIKTVGSMFFLGLKLAKLRFFKIDTKDIRIKDLEQFGSDFDTFWQKIKKDYNICNIRSSEYLNWRYIESTNKYKVFGAYLNDRLIGFVVSCIEYKKAKDNTTVKLCHIVDILCDTEYKSYAMSCLLDKVEWYAISEGACAISCWMLKHWFYADYLSRMGYWFFRSPSVLAYAPLESLKSKEQNILLNTNNWYITIGDSDYV